MRNRPPERVAATAAGSRRAPSDTRTGRVSATVLATVSATFLGALLPALTDALPAPVAASAPPAQEERRLTVTPETLELRVGETASLTAEVRGPDGVVDPGRRVLFFSLDPADVSVTHTGIVSVHRAGDHTLVALAPDAGTTPGFTAPDDPGVRVEIPVRALPSELARLTFPDLPEQVLVGATLPIRLQAEDTGSEPRDVRTEILASPPEVAVARSFGPLFEGTYHAHPFYDRPRPPVYRGDAAAVLRTLAPGTVTLTARLDGLTAEARIEVLPNPARTIALTAAFAGAPLPETVRTGDVVRLSAQASDEAGAPVPAAPVRFRLESHPDPSRAETVGAGAPAQLVVSRSGSGPTASARFVAEQPGLYLVSAASGPADSANAATEITVRVVPRQVAQTLEFVGQAPVRDRGTSDLWVWEGPDGRDYAALGTWNAEGHVYFFDVTDPTAMRRISEVQVDARTVNDVKVSADGRIGVITREGASNRRNGLVILDLADPANPEILSRFDDELTGGVHNVFLHEGHIYAINNGRRFDVINAEDPKNPFRVSRFEDLRPGRSVHDVWIEDGIAFQAGNTDGLVVVDVGGGGLGGSPRNPVEMGRLYQLTGWNHAVWPFRSRSAGKFYVVTGDESHPVNPRIPGPIIAWEERMPSRAMGWLHFNEFDDPAHPEEVARYRVPDAGPHNLWIDTERDLLYAAFFNGGLRVVDVSGELLGDLYRQGREVAKFYPDDPEGFVANAPFVWGPQPHKGVIFFSDFNSGLWAVRLVPAEDRSPRPAP